MINDNGSPGDEPVPEGKTRFISGLDLALKAGDYHVRVSHEVKSTEPEASFCETLAREYNLSVRGERFRLPDGAIHSLSPPADKVGVTGLQLPHVVFSNSSFPWQRALGGAAPDTTPWLAVLLFDEYDEPKPAENLTIDELFDCPGGVFHAYSKPEPWEIGSAEDPARAAVIDVPANVFNQIAPCVEDLGYLAHIRWGQRLEKSFSQRELSARTVDLHADLLRTQPQEIEFALLLGNRLPRSQTQDGSALERDQGLRHTAYLVSLEGFGEVLPTLDGTRRLPQGTEWVRLVSLHTWSFTVTPNRESLVEMVLALDTEPATLRVKPKTLDAAADDTVAAALSLGYTPLDHFTRKGDRTVSWYRGPLAPRSIAEEERKRQNSADGSLRYGPEKTGMFDVSYAAAWALGRLLALQSTQLASNLIRWRDALIERTRSFVEHGWSAAELEVAGDASAGQEGLLQEVCGSISRGLDEAQQALGREEPPQEES